MSNYLKNMDGYTLQQLRGYSFDEIKTLFETTIRKVNTFVLIESEVDRAVPELAARSSKRDAKEELNQESSKRQKTGESSKLAEEPRVKKADELSQEELQQMMIIAPEQGMNRLSDSCGVHNVSTEKGIDIYMLVEKEYPLSRGTLTLMLVAKLLVDQDYEMSREPLRKIFMQESILSWDQQTTLPPPPLPQSTTDLDLANRISTLEKRSADLEKKTHLHDKTTQALASRVYKLEHHDLYSQIDKQVNKVIKEAVHNALRALLHERFRDLSEVQMKEILHDQMFESNSYRSYMDHTTLYEALEASMQRDNNDELHAELTKSRKRRRDDQDPPPPPLKDSDQNDMHLSESEDTGAAHLPKINTRPDWLKPLLEEEAPETPEPDWVIPPNDLPETENN
ncbi:hypothetical protein Tco_1356247 [Tanacetum coccineum]